MNFIYKIAKFMYGRYGLDDLSKFLFKIVFILFLFNILFRTYILLIIELLLLVIIIFRILSKKIYRRNKENTIYLKVKKIILKPFKNIIRNYQDKEHIYKKCRKCKKTLKLPLPEKKGIKHTKCPNCKKKITFFTLRKQKIEIITNKTR